jgi:predicted lipoprotein with Yx(FWY)xxD motif
MKKIWILLGIALLGAVLALGVACSDDDEDSDGDSPTATAEMADETPMDDEPTAPADGQPTEPSDGEPSGFSTLVVTDGILTTFDGYTVYTFDNDEAGVSNCDATCAGTWPPLPVAGEATGGEGVTGTVSTITRDDGSTQVTYDDQPLYMYSGDASPGDTNGDGLLGVWHVVTIN